MADEHDVIAKRIADQLVSVIYVSDWGHSQGRIDPHYHRVEINSESMRAAVSMAFATFAREYGLKPREEATLKEE
jgi:hypothetical protein